MRFYKSLICFTIFIGILDAAVLADDNQLFTLGGTSTERFAITEKQWPAEVGQAHVCLWKDDAHAAVSITIDDNTVPDHDWWLATCETYGIKVTWFIITHQVTANPGFCGPWSQWQAIHAAGHDVQSHTVTHLNFDRGFDPDDPAHDIIAEYANSITDIETNVPGTCVETLAYPGGTNSSYNDHAIAAQYYIAARGGQGGTINQVNKVDYNGTGSISAGMAPYNESAPWTQLVNIFDASAYRTFYYRGWYVTHFHLMNDTLKAQVISGLNFLAAKDAEVGVWTDTFRSQAKYGQERDTATLMVDTVSPEQIRFTLSDCMLDSRFDYPLTVKVRIYDEWSGCSATQNGQATGTEIIEHDGARYALVQAVPDRGQVILSAGAARLDGDCDGDGDVDIYDFLILRSNYGTASGATLDMGDFDSDGDVDIYDFLMLRGNYGN